MEAYVNCGEISAGGILHENGCASLLQGGPRPHTTSTGQMQFSHKITLQTSAGEIFTLIVTVLMVESNCYSTIHSNFWNEDSITVLCRRSMRKATAGLYCLLHWCSIWMDCIYKLEFKLLPTSRRGWCGMLLNIWSVLWNFRRVVDQCLWQESNIS